MLKLAGRTAVVTGAAGGIGRGIALALVRRGCHVALAGLDEAALARTATEIAGQESARSLRVSHYRLDVANRAAVAALPAQVMAAHGAVDILVNNAGVALGGTFLEVAESDFDWLVGVNFWGVVQMTRAFLPLLSNSEEARVVNVSSLFGSRRPARPPTRRANSRCAVFPSPCATNLPTPVSASPWCILAASPRRSPRMRACRQAFLTTKPPSAAPFSIPSSPCRRKRPAKSLFAASNGERRVFWLARMPSMLHSSSG